jgi:hypothetical protein
MRSWMMVLLAVVVVSGGIAVVGRVRGQEAPGTVIVPEGTGGTGLPDAQVLARGEKLERMRQQVVNMDKVVMDMRSDLKTYRQSHLFSTSTQTVEVAGGAVEETGAGGGEVGGAGDGDGGGGGG